MVPRPGPTAHSPSPARQICFALGFDAQEMAVRVDVSTGDQLAQLAEQEMTWTYAPHDKNDRQPRDHVVDVEAATLYAARARAESAARGRAPDGKARRSRRSS